LSGPRPKSAPPQVAQTAWLTCPYRSRCRVRSFVEHAAQARDRRYLRRSWSRRSSRSILGNTVEKGVRGEGADRAEDHRSGPLTLPPGAEQLRRRSRLGRPLADAYAADARLRTAILDHPPGTQEDGTCAHRHPLKEGERGGTDSFGLRLYSDACGSRCAPKVSARTGRLSDPTMSRRRSSFIARRAGGESSAATVQQPRLSFRRANQGRLDHSREPAAMRLSLASAHGGARPVASARLGNGRSRFAGPRRRIRLEGPAQAKAAIRPHHSVQHSSPTSLWKLWKVRLWNRRRTLGVRAGGPATLRRAARCEVTRTGDVREKPRKERELSQALPNVCHGLADRKAPPCVRRPRRAAPRPSCTARRAPSASFAASETREAPSGPKGRSLAEVPGLAVKRPGRQNKV
jgi:hypothetical protein